MLRSGEKFGVEHLEHRAARTAGDHDDLAVAARHPEIAHDPVGEDAGALLAGRHREVAEDLHRPRVDDTRGLAVLHRDEQAAVAVRTHLVEAAPEGDGGQDVAGSGVDHGDVPGPGVGDEDAPGERVVEDGVRILPRRLDGPGDLERPQVEHGDGVAAARRKPALELRGHGHAADAAHGRDPAHPLAGVEVEYLDLGAARDIEAASGRIHGHLTGAVLAFDRVARDDAVLAVVLGRVRALRRAEGQQEAAHGYGEHRRS